MKEELEDGKVLGLVPCLARGNTFMIVVPEHLLGEIPPHLCAPVTTRKKGRRQLREGGEEVGSPPAGLWAQHEVDPPPPSARDGDMSSWHVGDAQAEADLATSSNQIYDEDDKGAGEEGRVRDALPNPPVPAAHARQGGGEPQGPPQFHFRSERQAWSPIRQREYELSLKGKLTPQEQEELVQLHRGMAPRTLHGAPMDEGNVSSHGGAGAGSEGQGAPSHLCTDSVPQPRRRSSRRVVGPEGSNVRVESHPSDPPHPQESQRAVDPPRSNVSMKPQASGLQEEKEDLQETVDPDGSNVSEYDPPPGLQETLKKSSHVMDIDWMPWYEECSVSKVLLGATKAPREKWPPCIRLEGVSPARRLYVYGRLLVPQGLARKVLMAHHVAMGHMGVKRMEVEAIRMYHFAGFKTIRGLLGEVKSKCQTCQACAPPNWSTHGPIEMSAVPDRCMASVALDLFSLPKVEKDGKVYDSILLCVDRQSGWIVAVPCAKKGLTGKKAALLMLEKWEMFGIPDTIVSDKGQQFVSAWWRTLCAGLGIRQSFSLVYRSQTNGRAEVAGRTVIELLRKIHEEAGSNWLEALPRALRHHNDAINDTGMSPYQILFGRDRTLGGIPREGERSCEDARQFLERMAEVDDMAGEAMRFAHSEQKYRVNKGRKERQGFKVGDLVWVARPKTGVTGHKMHTAWVGPAKVVQQLGSSTYEVQTKPHYTTEVHLDQLKRYVPDDITGKSYKLFYHQTEDQLEDGEVDEYNVQEILGHRMGRKGWEVLTIWEGYRPEEATWEPVGHFFHRYTYRWVAYRRADGLYGEVKKLLQAHATPT